jgi:beta-lactamase class A
VHDLRHRETYGLRAEEPFPPASTIKLFILRELFRQVEIGRVSLAEDIVLHRADIVPGTGVLKDLDPGFRLRLADAAMLMVTVSDNVATNLLIDRLGTRAINRATREAGYTNTRLSGKLYRRHRLRSTTTASDLGRLMLEIARLRAISRAASLTMLDMLHREQFDHIVGRLLPSRPVEHPGHGTGWKIASKMGSLAGVRNDVAYVEGPGARYVVVLMSRGCDDLRFCVDNEASLCLARIAWAVHQHASRRMRQ